MTRTLGIGHRISELLVAVAVHFVHEQRTHDCAGARFLNRLDWEVLFSSTAIPFLSEPWPCSTEGEIMDRTAMEQLNTKLTSVAWGEGRPSSICTVE